VAAQAIVTVAEQVEEVGPVLRPPSGKLVK
jgi:hypothetical protein